MQLEKLMARCSTANEQFLNDTFKNFPQQMQQAIKACYCYANTNDKRGLRYTNRWILECLLLRIKSRKAYQHLRNHNILAVPTIETLNTYIKNMQPRYGFDPQLFTMLRKKSEAMKPEERRGNEPNYKKFHIYF